MLQELPDAAVAGRLEELRVRDAGAKCRDPHAALPDLLAEALAPVEVPANPYGASMLLFAFALLGLVAWFLLTDQQAVGQSLKQMLRLP